MLTEPLQIRVVFGNSISPLAGMVEREHISKDHYFKLHRRLKPSVRGGHWGKRRFKSDCLSDTLIFCLSSAIKDNTLMRVSWHHITGFFNTLAGALQYHLHLSLFSVLALLSWGPSAIIVFERSFEVRIPACRRPSLGYANNVGEGMADYQLILEGRSQRAQQEKEKGVLLYFRQRNHIAKQYPEIEDRTASPCEISPSNQLRSS